MYTFWDKNLSSSTLVYWPKKLMCLWFIKAFCFHTQNFWQEAFRSKEFWLRGPKLPIFARILVRGDTKGTIMKLSDSSFFFFLKSADSSLFQRFKNIYWFHDIRFFIIDWFHRCLPIKYDFNLWKKLFAYIYVKNTCLFCFSLLFIKLLYCHDHCISVTYRTLFVNRNKWTERWRIIQQRWKIYTSARTFYLVVETYIAVVVKLLYTENMNWGDYLVVLLLS